MKKRSVLFVNIAVLLFGLAGLFAKWINLPAISITFGRVLFSSVALGAFMLLRKESFRLDKKRDLILLIIAGVILAIHWWSFLESIKISTVAIGTITFSSFPLFVTILEAVVFRQKLNIRNVIIAVIILIGVFVTIPEFSFSNNMFLGIIIGLLSSFTYAVLTLMNSTFTGKYTGTLTAFYEQSTAAVVLLPVVLKGGFSPAPSDLLLLVFLGIITTAFAHTLFITGLKDISASLAGIYSSMETVYGILFALILLGEIPSIREIAGACIITGVVILAGVFATKK